MKRFLNSLRDAFMRQHPLKRTVSVMAAAAMAVSLMTPAIAAAADTGMQKQKIESFSGTLVRGASADSTGRMVWTPASDADDHRFTFRVDYSMSGVKELPPGAIRITVPKSILRDRNGNAADYTDMSIPSEDEAKAADPKDDIPYTWRYSDDGASIIVTNTKERTAGEEGSFEIAYITTEQTFEYADMGASEPFHAEISVTNNGQTVTAKSAETPVYINTTAAISSTSKGTPEKLYRTWQPSWGTQPEEAKGKNYLIWQVVSKIRKDPTQPYSFRIVDTPKSSQLHLIGYSMGSQNGPFTDVSHVEGQRSDSDRYDYVLTWHDPQEFDGQDHFQLKNSVVATVTPEDGIDAPTSASSSRTWEWDKPKFVHPAGHFSGQKYGDSNWHDKFGKYHDYSSYSLDKLQDGKINSIDTFRYYISTYGYPAPWTLDGDADNPDSYGKKKVTYQLTDDELYLNDKITSKKAAGEKLEYDIPKDAKKLTSKDYQFLYADWSMSSDIRTFSDEEKRFVTDPNGRYSADDVVHFWAKTDDGEYREAASYSMGTGTASIADSSVVSGLDGKRITFAESANVTGIRITTSNTYWYTIIEAYPMARLKNSDYVMKTIKGQKMVRLHDFAQSDVSDSTGKNIFSMRTYAFDRAASPQRHSGIEKHVTSTGSNRTKRKYTIRWAVTPKETITTDEGTDYLVQKSGTFYDLLPKGTHLVRKSIDVETEKGMLSHSSFSYKVTEDYMGSGRDLVTVKIPVEAKYYRLYLSADMSWEAIRDYGTTIVNPVAYETGNEDIHGGYADTGGDSQLSKEDKAYLTGLDGKSSGKRFIYAQAVRDIDTVTAAVSGLRKQVRDEHDASYSYDTYTTPNGSYSYRIRFANTAVNKASDLILFDSIENYSQMKSDWHGTLKRIDVSQLKEKGISPVIYVSQAEGLSIEDNHDLSDVTVWQKAADSTDWSKVKAFAIDCRKKADGTDFILNAGESLSAVAYMQAPASVAEVNNRYAKAYNNIYVQDTIISGETKTPMFIHQDYTELRYRVAADIAIHKQSADDANVSIEGAKYSLKGESDYGTDVSEEVTTGAGGDAVFEGIEKGTYKLKETHSPDDWLLDRTEYTVKVDGTGKVTFNGKDEKIVLKDSPRIHGDISFMKLSTKKGGSNPVKGAKFRLEGKSHYGTDVMEYATSDDSGRVTFSNIEWGDYRLKEVVTPDGYIPNGKEYDASVSDAGVGGISDAEMLASGSPVIRNEPYHTVEVSKQSSYDGSLLEGAEFRLTGTSDYGTAYDLKATSGSNGLAGFKGLEAGTYVLQETKAPKGHIFDATKRAVRVNIDGTYTIDGLSLNGSGKYRQDNEKAKDGRIVVRKRWNDGKTNDQRPTPVIHITTDVSKIPTYAVWRNNYTNRSSYGEYMKSAFYYVDPDYKDKVKKVEYADIPESEVPADAVRLDASYADPDSRFKIYGWLTDGTLYYWTNAQTTRMTDATYNLFSYMKGMTSADLSHIDTSNVTSMSNMFSWCTRLTSLDLSSFNTSNVTNMEEMFYYCGNLASIDLSSFNTSNVTNMNEMFYNCSKLTSLDLSSFNTSKVTDMLCMFSGCSGLTSLDVSHFDTSQVTDMRSMFSGCSKLKSLDVSSFDTSKVTDMRSMFSGCSKLKSLDVSSFDTSKVTDMSRMFNGCSGLKSLDLSSFNTSQVTNMWNMFNGCSGLTSLDLSPLDTSNVTDMSRMFNGCSGLTSLDVSHFDTSQVTDMRSMFSGCSKLKSLDVSSFDTSKVTGMGGMFSGCSGLTSLDLSSFNTSKVTGMSYMFSGCKELTSLDLSPFDTSKVTDMWDMFYGCESLTSLDLSGFDTSKVTDMSQMFDNCPGLKSLDLSSFDTSKVAYMYGMFHNCKGLTSLDMSGFDTSKVTDMRYMFRECSGLTSLDLSSFATSKVTDMSYMFRECSGLTSLDLSSFDTAEVTNMSWMFDGCSGLTSLDISSFDTSKVTDMSGMFNGCLGLKNIYVSDCWSTEKVTYSNWMFYGSTHLPNYGWTTDATHANYGDGGYLTYKAKVSSAKSSTNSIASSLMSAASSLAKTLMSYIITPVHAAGSAEYSSGSKDCTITKNGDEWTYEFSVADDSTKYYAYEDNLEGYVSSNDVNSYGVATKDNPLTITNTSKDISKNIQKAASLSLTKAVDGKQLVTVDKPATRYSHTSNIDDAGKATGTYASNLNTNDVVTIDGASKLHVKLYYSTESTSYDWACVWAGKHPDYTAYNDYSSSNLGSATGRIGGGSKSTMTDASVIEGNIDGDSVTFGFRSDGSGQYYGYYAVVTGYDASGNAVTDKVKEYSDTKTVAVPSRYSSKTYTFNVTLSNSDSSKLAGTKIFGDTAFTDGKAKVGVKPGEKKTIPDLPAGTTYTVEEEKYRWFGTESENAKGTLNAGDSKTVKFNNHYTPGKVLDYKPGVGFTLKKSVKGWFQKKASYPFGISFKGLAPGEEYRFSGGKSFTADDDGNGYVETSLGDGASITFSKLPVGAQYKITESGGDWTPSYRISNASSDGDIEQTADSAEKNASLSTAWETVDADEDITVDFTNTVKKYQNITLKKTVKGGEAPDRFRFRIDFSDLHDTVRSDAGTIVPEDDGTASVDVYLGGGEEMKFSNVPVTAKYQITELANAGTASYAINADNPVKASDRNDGPVKDLSTAVETVDEGEDATVEFTNTLPRSASVTLTKKVGGMFADPDRYFRFTVSLTGASANQDYQIDLTKGSSEHDGKKNPQFLKTDASGNATADVWLKHGDTITLKSLPLDAKYSIAEEKTNGYETTVTANGADVSGISERGVQADSIVFINRSGGILPTGMHRTHALVILAAINGIAVAAVATFMLKRRKRKEN